MPDLKRNLYRKVNQLLDMFPAVLITGVRQGGKTTLARMCRPDWEYYDLENPEHFDRIEPDTAFFFKQKKTQIILDEAQELPSIFKVLRGVIDKNRPEKGRFIITGSCSQDLLKAASDSLAGRVAIVELGTLKMNESLKKPLSPFYEIFKKPLSAASVTNLLSLETNLTLQDVNRAFLKGGYPEPITSDQPGFYQAWMANYFATYLNRDVRALFPKLDLVKYRRFLSMLANLSGQLINRSEIGRSIETNEKTIRDYLEIAHGTYVWRNYLSFDRDKSRSIVKMPRGGIRDAGLLNYLLKISDLEQLNGSLHVGRFFENFVCDEIIKGLEALGVYNWDYHYYRTRNGAEIDLVLSGDFGLLPIEIKYGIKTDARKLTTLKQFVKDRDLPLGIVVNNADKPDLIADRIIQLPANYL
ncbi:ATP-binding protein [Planctomycetota bacterium]